MRPHNTMDEINSKMSIAVDKFEKKMSITVDENTAKLLNAFNTYQSFQHVNVRQPFPVA